MNVKQTLMNRITTICVVLFLSIYNISEAQEVQRVYLDFETPLGFVSSLLLNFTPNNAATDGVDPGWDSLSGNTYPDDLNWLIEGNRYVIQSVGAFDETKKYPLGLYLTNSGTITISLNRLENFDPPIDVYIYDALLDTYIQINNANYTAVMSSGNYIDKYFIAFLDPALSLDQSDLNESEITYLKKTKELYINTHNNSNIKQISLYNLLGQEIFILKDISQGEIKISLNHITTDVSVVNIITDKGVLNKKIITH